MPVNPTLSGSDTLLGCVPWALPTAIPLHAFRVMNRNPCSRGVHHMNTLPKKRDFLGNVLKSLASALSAVHSSAVSIAQLIPRRW